MSPSRHNQLPPEINIRHSLNPGDIGYITYLHGILYAQEYGWDNTFEVYVAGPLAQFARAIGPRERIWIVEKDEAVRGSIAIVEAGPEQAQLRWFLLHPDLRGHGIGRWLVDEAISFCRKSDYASIFLGTVSALSAAAHLYLSAGFKVTEESTLTRWGSVVTEQRYELTLR